MFAPRLGSAHELLGGFQEELHDLAAALLHDVHDFAVIQGVIRDARSKVRDDGNAGIGHAAFHHRLCLAARRHADKVAAQLAHEQNLARGFIARPIETHVDAVVDDLDPEFGGSGKDVGPRGHRVRKIDVLDLMVEHGDLPIRVINEIAANHKASHRPFWTQATDGGSREAGLCPQPARRVSDRAVVHQMRRSLVPGRVTLNAKEASFADAPIGSARHSERSGHVQRGESQIDKARADSGPSDQNSIAMQHLRDTTLRLRATGSCDWIDEIVEHLLHVLPAVDRTIRRTKDLSMGVIKEVKVNDIYDLLDVAYAEGNVKLDAYLSRVLKKTEEWFGASGISVFLRQGDTDRYALMAAVGLLSTVPKDAVITKGQGIAGIAIEEERPRLLVDPRNETDLAERGIQKKDQIGSSLIVPLVTRHNGCIGVLNVARAADAPTFAETDLEAAESLGRQIALAVNNAQAIVSANSRRMSLQNAIESVGFGLIMIAEDGTFSDFTAEVSTILGADPTMSANWTEFAAKISDPFQAPFRHAMDRAKKNMSYRFRVADDVNHKAYAVVVSPLHGGGAIVALSDITEHEKARETVERIHRLAEIGQLTASIAHEIRNPLAGIQSAATMIMEDPHLATEFASMIEKEATKLNHLCSEFLDFAKPISLEFEPIRLGDIARNVCQRHVDQFEAAQVGIKLQISPDEPILYADALRIEQVVRNLLLNALQASEPGGFVTLQVMANGVLRVIDEGSGMEREVVERLFTPFFTTKPNGTGLGLSIARKIVDAHKAKLGVNSTPGEGSTFELDFNVSEAA